MPYYAAYIIKMSYDPGLVLQSHSNHLVRSYLNRLGTSLILDMNGKSAERFQEHRPLGESKDPRKAVSTEENRQLTRCPGCLEAAFLPT